MLTIYDWHGNYGHPDHIKVHRVGVRAAEMVADDLPGLRVFEATMNRDAIAAMVAQAAEAGMAFGPDDDEFDPHGPADDGNPFGMAEAELTHEVDVSGYVGRQADRDRQPSQPGHRHRLLPAMPDEMFAAGFGREWFIEHGREPRAAPRLALRRMTLSTVSTWSDTVGRQPVGTAIRIPTSTSSVCSGDVGRGPVGGTGRARPARRHHQSDASLPSNRRRCCASGGRSPLASTKRSARSRRRKVSRWPSGWPGSGATMVGTWTELGEPYTTFRDGVVARIQAVDHDTVAFSHFVAINAVIGACLGDDRLVIRRLDNCSVTVVDVDSRRG